MISSADLCVLSGKNECIQTCVSVASSLREWPLFSDTVVELWTIVQEAHRKAAIEADESRKRKKKVQM